MPRPPKHVPAGISEDAPRGDLSCLHFAHTELCSEQKRCCMQDKWQQWFFLILVALWLLLSIIAPIEAFCITGSVLCLTISVDIAPPAYLLYLLACRLFPPSENETRIAIAKQKRRKAS